MYIYIYIYIYIYLYIYIYNLLCITFYHGHTVSPTIDSPFSKDKNMKWMLDILLLVFYA